MSPDTGLDAFAEWQLECYLLGELPPDETAALGAALAAEPGLRAHLNALERSSADILARHPAPHMAARVRAAAGRDTPSARPFSALGSGPLVAATALAAAAVLGTVVLRPAAPPAVAPRDVTRVKGLAPRVVLYRRAPAGIERLASGAHARDHDVIQIAYQTGGHRHGVIVSVDGRGTVTRHLPVSGALAAPLQAGPSVLLAQAYELDDAPGFERFYLVTADEPFAVESVVAAARRSPGDPVLPLPPTMDQYSFVLEKETPQ